MEYPDSPPHVLISKLCHIDSLAAVMRIDPSIKMHDDLQ